jgi:hypothetical protein
MISMANQRSSGRKNGRSDNLNARDVVKRVRQQLPEMLGRPVESILGVQRGEDGGWEVAASVVELSRIPQTTDIIGVYRVTVDDDGELVAYTRQRRYNRSQADED